MCIHLHLLLAKMPNFNKSLKHFWHVHAVYAKCRQPTLAISSMTFSMGQGSHCSKGPLSLQEFPTRMLCPTALSPVVESAWTTSLDLPSWADEGSTGSLVPGVARRSCVQRHVWGLHMWSSPFTPMSATAVAESEQKYSGLQAEDWHCYFLIFTSRVLELSGFRDFPSSILSTFLKQKTFIFLNLKSFLWFWAF